MDILTFWLIWGLIWWLVWVCLWGMIVGLLAIGAGLGKPFQRDGFWGSRLIFLLLAVAGALVGGVIGLVLFGLDASIPLAIVGAIVAVVMPILVSRLSVFR